MKMHYIAGTRVFFLLACLFLNVVTHAKPPKVATTTESTTTHIVSYVRQQKNKLHKQQLKEFDFETLHPKPINKAANLMLEESGTTKSETDDLLSLQKNTLENANEKDGEQHESTLAMPSAYNESATADNHLEWHRVKQSIPVLQQIQHLLDHINNREGNHTVHHKLLADVNATTESAIETERDREMINGSNELGFLEFFGSLGVMAWEFISNIFKFLTGASGAIFSGSSG